MSSRSPHNLHSKTQICTDKFFIFFSLDSLLPTPCRCRRYCCPWSLSMTHTYTHKDSSKREIAWQHKIHRSETSMPSAGVEPTIKASKRPQTQALDRAVTGIGYLWIVETWLCTCRIVIFADSGTEIEERASCVETWMLLIGEAGVLTYLF